MTSQFPDTALLVSNADPNDPAATDAWTDVAPTRTYRVNSARRGRQYELDQVLAGSANFDLRNADEYLNPANGSSPLLAYAKPMRRIRWMCMYPRAGTGNLLNPNNPRPGDRLVQDGSFESYNNGDPAPVWVLTTGSVVPTITTTNPQQGTKSLTFAIANTSTQQGIGYKVATIPGRQYTAQVQVRQTAANTMQIYVNGGPSGTTTATTAAYVKLTVTFTASATETQLWVVSFTPTLNSTVNVDALMSEPGGSASAFSTAGPRIRGLWCGHIDRVPNTWEPGSSGYKGQVALPCVGALAALSNIPVRAGFSLAVLATNPDYYWPLWDGATATQFSEISGHNGPPLSRYDSPVGAGSWSQGSATGIPGDLGGVGLSTNSGANAGLTGVPASSAQTGYPGTNTRSIQLGTTPPCSFTISGYASWSMFINSSGTWLYLGDSLLQNYVAITWFINPPEQQFASFHLPGHSASAPIWNSSADYGKPHHFVITFELTATTVQAIMYVDGVLVSTGSVTSTVGWSFGTMFPIQSIQVGAASTNLGLALTGLPSGVYSHIALWNRKLSTTEIATLGAAGAGWSGELTGARLNRLLSAYYTGPINLDAGSTVLGPSSVTDQQLLQTAVGRITDTELGVLFENRDGYLEFDGRARRYLTTTSMGTFGENSTGGESPYEDAPVFGYDLTQVSNTATLTQSLGGVKVLAGPDAASQKSYYQRGYTLTVDSLSALDVQDHANWVVANRKQPKQRLVSIRLNPGANPNLWPIVLDLEIGQRYTVVRRPKAANGGVGITMTGDYFLENIAHTQVDPELGTWYVDLQLSPVPLQPWILGDSVYGVLDTTTILGF